MTAPVTNWTITQDNCGGTISTITTGAPYITTNEMTTSGWPDANTYTTIKDAFAYDIPVKDVMKAIERNTYGGDNKGKKMKGISSKNFKKVIFNDPATIIMWTDGTKTIVKAMEDDIYDPMVGLAMCICKKVLGSEYKRIFRKYEKQYDEQFENEVDVADIRDEINDVLAKARQLIDSLDFFESGDANGKDSKV